MLGNGKEVGETKTSGAGAFFSRVNIFTGDVDLVLLGEVERAFDGEADLILLGGVLGGEDCLALRPAKYPLKGDKRREECE